MKQHLFWLIYCGGRKHYIALVALLAIAAPMPAHGFWWGLSDREKKYCEELAAKERTDFSAKQTFERCSKSVKDDFKRWDKEAAERQKEEKRRQREKAQREAARKMAVKTKAIEIQARCQKYQPQWMELQEERELNYSKYSEQTKTFRPKMIQLYGQGYQSLAAEKRQRYSSYPGYVLVQFPWIKWYVEHMKKEDEILLAVAGPGTSQDELDKTTAHRWLMSNYGTEEKCPMDQAEELAKHLIKTPN